MAVDPKSPAQWQEAADAAYTLLLIESARSYGLVSGGLNVDTDRALEILDRARDHGIVPSADALERMLREVRDPSV